VNAVHRLFGATLAVMVGCAPLAACKRHPDVKPDTVASDAPPPFAVSDASEGLLATWIDEKGDFHVEQKLTDVPLVGRDAVRVVDPTKEDGTHSDRIFVADLRTARPDGTYPVKVMTRADFDALAVQRRSKNGGDTLANNPTPPAPSGAPGDTPGAQTDPSPAARPAVIIYGASWCSACHDAMAYLKRKGIPFVEKDIEQDAKAAQEMRSKLARAGLRSGSIPVLDVRGHVMVGFNPREVDAALGQAL
jgi:glutaredoxin